MLLFGMLACFSAFPIVAIGAGGGLSLATLPVAGNFDCADLQVILGKADMIWNDNQSNADYVPKADVLKVIVANTTAKLDAIQGEQSKDNKIKVTWLQDCNDDVEDCDTTTCIVEGEELLVNCKEYEPTICKTTAFIVNEDTLRAGIYSPEEVIAKGLLKRVKLLDEMLAQSIVSELDANKGVSVYAGDYGQIEGGTVGNSDVEVLAGNWTASLFGYLNMQAIKNKLANPFLLSGDNLYLQWWNAQAEFANADGKGNLNKFNTMPANFDLFNIDSVLNPSLQTFLIDKGAIAFAPKWRYSNTPRKIDNVHTRFTIESRTVPGMFYDVIYTTRCKTGTNQIEHVFNVTARGGIYLNPTGCTETKTGIVSFKKVSAYTS